MREQWRRAMVIGSLLASMSCSNKELKFYGPGAGGFGVGTAGTADPGGPNLGGDLGIAGAGAGGAAAGTGAGAGPLGDPGIAGAGAGSDTDRCDLTNTQALSILEMYCANCHAGRAGGEAMGMPPFDFVLDVERMKSARSQTAIDPVSRLPAVFLVPGDPDRSLIYELTASGAMPPIVPDNLPPPRPSASDISLLRFWIERCVTPAPTDPGDRDASVDVSLPAEGGGDAPVEVDDAGADGPRIVIEDAAPEIFFFYDAGRDSAL